MKSLAKAETLSVGMIVYKNKFCRYVVKKIENNKVYLVSTNEKLATLWNYEVWDFEKFNKMGFVCNIAKSQESENGKKILECSPCSKVGYFCRKDALKSRKWLYENQNQRLSAYQCNKCKKWHLGRINGPAFYNLERKLGTIKTT